MPKEPLAPDSLTCHPSLPTSLLQGYVPKGDGSGTLCRWAAEVRYPCMDTAEPRVLQGSLPSSYSTQASRCVQTAHWCAIHSRPPYLRCVPLQACVWWRHPAARRAALRAALARAASSRSSSRGARRGRRRASLRRGCCWPSNGSFMMRTNGTWRSEPAPQLDSLASCTVAWGRQGGV